MILKLPSLGDRELFIDYYKENFNPLVCTDYKRILDELYNNRKGINLREGQVPSVLYIAVEDGKIIGTVIIRPDVKEVTSINDLGNISINIRPSERGNGYAPLMLNLALEECIKYGLEDVLVMFKATNPPAIRTVEDNLGKYVNGFNDEKVPYNVDSINIEKALSQRSHIEDKIELNKELKQCVDKIIESNKDLFGEITSIKRIYVGFTNYVYVVNDKYIIKICNDKDNEEEFAKEVDYYNTRANEYNPKLYVSDLTKKDIQYPYEIIEKVNGVSLYNIWHTLDEEKREEIVKKICEYMKSIHTKEDSFEWAKELIDEFNRLFNKVKDLNIFKDNQIETLLKAYERFDECLKDNTFTFVHNDLHFDNIFYDGENIKIIDFERARVAPIDFELDIIYRMIDNPQTFAGYDTLGFTKFKDYQTIPKYINKYYPEITNIKYLDERLWIYDLVYRLHHLVNNSDNNYIKTLIMEDACKLAYKGRLSFDDLQTPQDLMNWMDANISYGWLDKDGNVHYNDISNARHNLITASIDDVFKSGVGTCIDQAKVIKYFLDKHNIENKVFCNRRYETTNEDKKIFLHCLVFFKMNDKWYNFEHSNTNKRGIREYDTLDEAIRSSINGNDGRIISCIDEVPEGLSFLEFNQYVNQFDEYQYEKVKSNN